MRSGTLRVPGESVSVALAVHLDVDTYWLEVLPRRPVARRRRPRHRQLYPQLGEAPQPQGQLGEPIGKCGGG